MVRRWLFFCLIAAVWLLPLWLTGEAFVGSSTDLTAYQYPVRQLAFGQLRHGHWPLWNPYIFSGLPFLATGFQSPLHPFSWLSALLPVALEVKVTLWLCLALSGFTMSGLLLELGHSRNASLIGGVLWLGGCQPCQRAYAGHLDVLLAYSHMAWLPWALLVALRTRRVWLAGPVLALAISTGHYHIVYLTGCLAVFLTLGRAPVGRWLATWGCTAVLGLGLTAFQWLSLPSLLSWTSRAQMSLHDAASVGAQVPAFLTLLWPRLFEGLEPHTSWCTWPGWEGQCYVGLLALALAVCGARRRPLWAAGVLFFALLAAGAATPVYGLLFSVDPLLSKLRAPFRFSLVALALVICLAARGYDELEERAPRARFAIAAAVGTAIVGLLTLLHPGADALYQSLVGQTAPEGQWGAVFVRTLPGLAAAAAGLLALVFAPEAWRARAFGGVIALELWLLALPLWITAPLDTVQLPSPLAAAIAAEPGVRVVYSEELTSWLDRGVATELSAAGGYDRLADWRYMRALKVAMGVDPEVAGTLASPYASAPFWNLQGVGFAIGTGRLPGADFEGVTLPGIEPFQLFRNSHAQSRAFLVYQAELRESPEALDAIANGTLDASAQVVVGKDLFDAVLKHLGDQGGEIARGSVSHLQVEPNQLSLDVATPQAGVLVVTDAPEPGWSATLDGRSTALLAVNGWLHRAVLVPSGQHRVVMSYRPPHWREGCLASLFFGVVLVLLVFLA